MMPRHLCWRVLPRADVLDALRQRIFFKNKRQRELACKIFDANNIGNW